MLELPNPTALSEELTGLAYSNNGVLIEDNDHITEDIYDRMFSILAPIGLSLTILTTKEKEDSIIKLIEKHHIGKYNIITDRDKMFYNFIRNSHEVYLDLSEERTGMSEYILNNKKTILNNTIENDVCTLVNSKNTIECIKKIILLIGNPYKNTNEFKDIISDYEVYISKTWGDFIGDED